MFLLLDTDIMQSYLYQIQARLRYEEIQTIYSRQSSTNIDQVSNY